MKKIVIEKRIDEISNQSATAIATTGYKDDCLSDQFELLGVVTNLMFLVNDRIKKLGETSFKNKNI